MEHLETGLKHRNSLLSAILNCDGMTVQYIAEMIEEYGLDATDAVHHANEAPSGLSLDSLLLFLMEQAYEKFFEEIRNDFDPENEYDLDGLKFREQYIKIHPKGMDSHITIKAKLAIKSGWPENFVNKLSEKLIDI